MAATLRPARSPPVEPPRSRACAACRSPAPKARGSGSIPRTRSSWRISAGRCRRRDDRGARSAHAGHLRVPRRLRTCAAPRRGCRARERSRICRDLPNGACSAKAIRSRRGRSGGDDDFGRAAADGPGSCRDRGGGLVDPAADRRRIDPHGARGMEHCARAPCTERDLRRLAFAGGAGAGRILFADALVAGASLAVRRPRVDRPRPSASGRFARRRRACGRGGRRPGPCFSVQAIAEPMWATDHLAIWGLKGRLAFLAPALKQRLFLDPALAWSHPEYPLLVPLSLAAFAGLVGAWNDQALALLWPACELGTLLALAGFLGRRVSRSAGAGAAALTALCFPLYGALNVGTAEVPLAFAFVLVCCALLDILEVDSPNASHAWRRRRSSVFRSSRKARPSCCLPRCSSSSCLQAKFRPRGARASPLCWSRWRCIGVCSGS